MIYTLQRLVIILGLFTIFASATAQNLRQEMPLVLENGVLKCKRIIVSFYQRTIDVPRGTSVLDLNRYPVRNQMVRDIIDSLSQRYSTPTIRKTMPHLVWGDTLVYNRRTQRNVVAPDMSQEIAIDFPVPIPLHSTLRRLRQVPGIRYAEQPITIRTLVEPNDYSSSEQWNLDKVNAPRAWDISTGSSSVEIAVIDEGGDINAQEHLDIADQIISQDDRQSGAHFMYVAGVAGAKTNNEIGIASLSWNTKLRAYHFGVNTESGSRLPTLIDNARLAGVDVINFSFETLSSQGDDLTACPTPFNSVLLAVERAYAAGVIMVAAAGNNAPAGCTPVPYPTWPASYDGVIAVSGTNEIDEFANPTWNYGGFVDVSAPAVSIKTTGFLTGGGSNYVIWDGTSFAAPLVSGLAALMKATNPSLTATDVEDYMKLTSVDLGIPGPDSHFGYGRINAYKALSMANGPPVPPENFAADILYLGENSHPRLNWTPNNEPDIEGYEVWRKIITSPIILEAWRVIATVGAGQTQYVDYSIHYAGSGPYTAYFKIKAFDAAGLRSGFSSEGSVNYGNAYKGTAGTSPTALAFELHQNSPNPFNPSTSIRYSIPSDGFVSLRVFDVLGQEIRSLVNEMQTQGEHKVTFEASDLPSGLYFSRLQYNGYTLNGKMLLTK